MRPHLVPLPDAVRTSDVPGPSAPSTAPPTTEVGVTDVTIADGGVDDGGVGLGVVVGLCLLAAGLAGLVGWIGGARRAARAVGGTPAAPPEPPPVVVPGPAEPEHVATELVDPARTRLVDGLIAVRDLIDNPALSDRIGTLLDSVGVTTLNPTGARFDPSEHQAQAPPALVGDRALDGTIADVISYGYRERGSITRFPVVIVNRYSAAAE